MRTRRPATSQDLRRAVDCLPRRTRIAMLEGIAGNEIIVGAYTNDDGICPMLAAHRAGGRTNLIAFARAWDRFAFRDGRSKRARRARRASERELRVLRSYLEASLLAEDAPDSDLAAARREHVALQQERTHRQAQAQAHARADAQARGDAAVALKPDQARPARNARRPGDADRSGELGSRPGWAWTRLVRRYDDYERVLARLESEQTALDEAGAGDGAREPALTH
jgi:hypothetical protein